MHREGTRQMGRVAVIMDHRVAEVTSAHVVVVCAVVGEPCQESEAGRADAGKDQVTY